MKKDLAKSKSKPLANSAPVLSFDLIIEVLLLVILFLIPIIFDRRLGIVFSGTKVAWLRAFIVVTLGVWAVKLIVNKEHRFIPTPNPSVRSRDLVWGFIRTALDWPVASFLLSTTVAALTSVHVYTSFVGFYGRFEGLSTWYLFGLLFFITTNYIHSLEQLKRIMAMVVSAATLMSVYGVIQRHELDPYMWGGVVTWQRVIGTIGQPNFLAAYILMAFFLTLILFLEERKVPTIGMSGQAPAQIDWFQQLPPLVYFLFSQVAFIVMIYTLEAQDVFLWYTGFALMAAAALLFAYTYEKLHPLILDLLLGFCLLLIYICLLYTQSRGGYMGFFTGGVLFTLVAGKHWLFKSWKKLTILGFFIILISGITMLRPEFSPFQRFTSEITTKKEVESPAGGETGLELKGAAGSRGETWKSAFKIIADYPLFGIGPEVLKMIFPRYETELFRFKEAFHVKQDRCHNETFDVPVTKGLISFFLYIWVVFTVFKVGLNKSRGASESQRLMLAGLLAAILAYLIQNQFSFGVVAITSLFWVMWGMVMKLGHEKEEVSMPLKLSLAEIPWLPVAGVVIAGVFLIYFSFLSFRGDVFFKSGKTYLEMRNLPQAAEDLQKSLKVFPLEGTTVSHLAIAYLNLGDTKEAVKYLNYGVAIDPYNADNFFMLSKVYLSYYDHGMKEALKDSLANTEIALKIDSYYAEAYEVKGQIFEREGKIIEAAQMYEKTFWVNPTLTSPIQEIEEVYRKLGQVDRARKIFEQAAKKYPGNIEVFKALERLK